MTLLSICTEVASDLALAVPAAIVGNNDETATRLLAAAQLAGQSLARKPQGGWVTMMREYDFVTSALASQSGSIANVGGFGVISGLASTVGVTIGTWQAFGTGVPK